MLAGVSKSRDLNFRKYRYMDQNLAQRRRGLEEKIPDIKKTLSMVEFLQERRVCQVSRFLTVLDRGS